MAALHGAGWKRVSPKQKAVLEEIADRHRRDGNDGTWFAVEAIAAAIGTDPLRAAIDADQYWQAAQKRRADAEESDWAAEKAKERADADRIFAGGIERPSWARRPADPAEVLP